ncbi:MAG: hypothetical protein ABJF88_13720 [Rhodothermales bacterium]
MRSLLSAALLAAFLFPAALSAQPTDSFRVAALVVQDEAPSAAPLPGAYESADAWLAVVRDGRALVLTLTGQPAFDAFADAPGDPAFNARAEALLRDAFAGSTDRLAAALPEHRREAGTRDFTRILDALTDRRGAVQSVRALGTADEAAGMAATFVRVTFADGEEVLKLKWRDGHLALVTRGVLPSVTALPVEGDARRYAVLDAAGTPSVLLTFGDGRLTVQNAVSTLVADRVR